MRVILDIMGGDNPPEVIIQGAIAAVNEYNTDILLVGDKRIIIDTLRKSGAPLERFSIVSTQQYIVMQDNPTVVVGEKKNSSMATGLRLLSEGKGDAFVSCGNTGALLTGATLIVRRIKGIRRAALGTILPFEKPLLLLDCGANVTVTAEYLEQFAYLGHAYMSKIYDMRAPKIGLVNNGSEPTKGTPIAQDAYNLLKNAKINFIGNVEGKDLAKGVCDVAVTDGFTGNVILKHSEGMGSFMFQKLKEVFTANAATMMSSVMIKGQLKQLKKSLDATEYGGAPFLGVSKPVIKAHGNSDANAIKNAIRQAISFVNSGVIEEIARHAATFSNNATTKSE